MTIHGIVISVFIMCALIHFVTPMGGDNLFTRVLATIGSIARMILLAMFGFWYLGFLLAGAIFGWWCIIKFVFLD